MFEAILKFKDIDTEIQNDELKQILNQLQVSHVLEQGNRSDQNCLVLFYKKETAEQVKDKIESMPHQLGRIELDLPKKQKPKIEEDSDSEEESKRPARKKTQEGDWNDDGFSNVSNNKKSLKQVEPS